jgi:hypothetical protein
MDSLHHLRMITFTAARWADYCARFSPECSAALRAAATPTPNGIEIPAETLAEITARCAPLPRRGLGDLVATFAEPIAALSDKHLGTHLVGCNACAQRRAALNRLVPDL